MGHISIAAAHHEATARRPAASKGGVGVVGRRRAGEGVGRTTQPKPARRADVRDMIK